MFENPLLENPLLENPLLENPLLEKVEQKCLKKLLVNDHTIFAPLFLKVDFFKSGCGLVEIVHERLPHKHIQFGRRSPID